MENKILEVITDAMLEKKGKNVVSLDLRPIGTAISDYFVVCNADSTTAVAAIADNSRKDAGETREEGAPYAGS